MVALAYVTVLAAALPPGAGAQNSDAPRRFNVDADSLTIRQSGSQNVLVLHRNVVIDDGDVVIRSQRGTHYMDDRHTFLVGDVKITQETMTLWGDEGEYFQSRALAIIRGNVRIVDEGWEVTADSVEYNRDTGHAWLRGNVVARDDATTLRADRIFYDRNLEMAEAFENVFVESESEGFFATGDHGYYYRGSREAVLDQNPRLTVDSDSKDPVTVDSDTMRVYPDSGQAMAYYRVKILKGNMVTQCDSAVVFDERKEAFLFGNPLAQQDNTAMKGQFMRLYYDKEQVNRVDIQGNAELKETNRDTLVMDGDSWIRGDSIQLHLSENRVDSIRVQGNALSEYRPTTPGKVERNFARGDEMFFRFENDSLSYVRFEGRAEGVYKYVDIDRSQTTDSLRAVADTNLTYRSFRDEAQKVVYSAKHIEYHARDNDLVLTGDARLQYQASTLTGKDITFYSEYELLDARGEPQLKDGDQLFYGERMNYDMEEESGLVIRGATQFGEGYFKGSQVGKGQDGSMKVWKSNYTTCDLAQPHFHFRAKEMKVYPGDKVVGSDLVMYIGDTPVFYLPFMANNIERGRRSGFLRPDIDIGINSRDGRFIRNIGYYWATNDYTDFTFVTDFNENSSMRGYVGNRYKLRYWFNGDLQYTFLRDFNDFTNQWEVRWRHNQLYLPWNMKFNAGLHFVSDEDAIKDINRIDDVERVTDRSLRSNATLSKAWGSSVRLNASATRVQNLNVVDPNSIVLDQTLPSVTLSIPSRHLYFGEPTRSGEAGFWEKVLTNMRYNPTLNGSQRTTTTRNQKVNVITVNEGLSLSSVPKVGFVNLTPAISANNSTVRRDTTIVPHYEDDTDSTQTFVSAYDRVVTDNDFNWNASVSARTNFYGTFYGKIGRFRALRHVLSPQASYRYTPARGNSPANQSVSMSLRNTFDMKVATDDSTTNEAGIQEETLRKLSNVVNWSLSTNYDPDLPKDRAWSDIRSAIAGQFYGVNMQWNQTVDPYEWRIEQQNATARFTIRGSHPFGKSNSLEVRELNIVAEHDTSQAGQEDEDEYPPLSGAAITQTGDILPGRTDAGSAAELELEEGLLPWYVNIDLTYSDTRTGDPRSTIRFASQFDVTKNWKISYAMQYDVFTRQQTGQNIAVSRDLHCWEMSLARQKLGEEWQYYFRIGLKAHPELYQESGQRGLGGGTLGTGSYF